jgi:hypothetical protein
MVKLENIGSMFYTVEVEEKEKYEELMEVFDKGFQTKAGSKLITESELRASKENAAMGLRLIDTGQLTYQCVIFDNFVKETGIVVYLSLIFKDNAPIDFNVHKWFNSRPLEIKEKISELIYDITFGDKDLINKYLSGVSICRCIKTDIVEDDTAMQSTSGSSQDLIGYFFNIHCKRF